MYSEKEEEEGGREDRRKEGKRSGFEGKFNNPITKWWGKTKKSEMKPLKLNKRLSFNKPKTLRGN